jgi:Leucine-rich repeat (LRR) protein
VQKIDLSFNNISDIHGILFSKMNSLKELLLNDNSISELPFSEMNQCRGLKLVNVNNNKLYILPPLTRPSFLEARMNPLRLVTSELVRLNQIEFVTFDWLEYLIEGGNYSGEDRYKEYAALYSRFKKNIL